MTSTRLPALVLVMSVALVAASGCSGLTAQEKGALVGGVGGVGLGAAFGAAAGSAALGALVGGPVGLVGGYLLGQKVFQTDPGRKNDR